MAGIIVYQSAVLALALVIVPLYLSVRWNVGEAGIFLGFGLAFWALGDLLCSSLTVGSGGICYLLREWYPIPFLIILRLFGGAILIMYLILNPDVGVESASIPELGRGQFFWAAKVGVILLVFLGVALAAYQSIAREGFEGDVLYVLTGDYRGLDQPELVYRGTLMQNVGENAGYVLFREDLDMPNLMIGRIGGVPWDAEVLNDHLGLEVEILGKLTEFVPGKPRLLYPGRIRVLGATG